MDPAGWFRRALSDRKITGGLRQFGDCDAENSWCATQPQQSFLLWTS
jgi:hypothetical protein